MKITAEPRSDQWNADDFVGGPRTFTIAKVTTGKAEQKYDIELVEGEGRSWRPPLTMLRLLIAAWGDEGSEWVGRKVTLFRDPNVRFGSDVVGGIRVSHMSHLPEGKPLKVKLTASRDKRILYTVEPLRETTPPPTQAVAVTADQIDACTDEAQLRKWWQASDVATKAIITERVQVLRHEQEASRA